MTITPTGQTIPSWTLADRLRKARELTGLDRSQFAELIGISRQSVSTSELGYNVPRELTLRVWSIATGVDLHWLKTGETNNAPSPDGVGAGLRAWRDSNPQPSDP